MNSRALIQFDNNGQWQTVTTLPSTDSQRVQLEMQNAKRTYPERRIRAVDDQGRLIDLLP